MTLSEKYPNGYFDHFLAMFISINTSFNEKQTLKQVELYKVMEGDKEFSNLKNELLLILKNNDIDKFSKICADYDCKFLNKEDLIKMAELIIKR